MISTASDSAAASAPASAAPGVASCADSAPAPLVAGGLDEVDGYPGLVAFRAEPGDTGVPGIVQLAQANDELGFFFSLVGGDGPADVAAGDVGVDLFGAQVDVDGMPAVDDLLQRHVDDGDTALDRDGGGRAGPFGVVTDMRDVSEWSNDVAQLGAACRCECARGGPRLRRPARPARVSAEPAP